jgi:hypothetical protein
MLNHLQLVTLWITVLNSHHLLKKRSINGSNSAFHNSPNCGSKWILCAHTSIRAYIYIYIYIYYMHIYLIFLFFFFFTQLASLSVLLSVLLLPLPLRYLILMSVSHHYSITSLGILVENWPNLFCIHLCNILSFSCNVNFNYFN